MIKHELNKEVKTILHQHVNIRGNWKWLCLRPVSRKSSLADRVSLMNIRFLFNNKKLKTPTFSKYFIFKFSYFRLLSGSLNTNFMAMVGLGSGQV